MQRSLLASSTRKEVPHRSSPCIPDDDEGVWTGIVFANQDVADQRESDSFASEAVIRLEIQRSDSEVSVHHRSITVVSLPKYHWPDRETHGFT